MKNATQPDHTDRNMSHILCHKNVLSITDCEKENGFSLCAYIAHA